MEMGRKDCYFRTVHSITWLIEFAKFSACRMSDSSSVLHRQCQHGGLVTVATIRFPPPDDQQQRDTGDYDSLKSCGRVVFARGPWIESHPLVSLSDKHCYKTLAYGEANAMGSSKTKCVHGMIFPSSSPSLAYLKSSSSSSSPTGTESTVPSRGRSCSALSSISIVAYGGRRVSFLSGGGLWSRLSNKAKRTDTGTQTMDDFQPISLTAKSMVPCVYLEVSDWIHDIRMMDIDCHCLSEIESDVKEDRREPTLSTRTAFLVAMAMASNLRNLGVSFNTFGRWKNHVTLSYKATMRRV